MKILYLKTFRFIVGWMLIFFILRVYFYLFNWNKFSGINNLEITKSFLFGLQMDFATIGPILFVPTVLQLVSNFDSRFQITNLYNLILLITVSLITIIDAGLASNWGTRISGQALSYLKEFRLIKESVISINYLTAIIMSIILFYLIKKLYKKTLKIERKTSLNPAKGLKIYFLFLIPVVLLIGLFTQGSFGTYRISKSQVFFSQENMINQATLNPLWSFIDVVYQINNKSSEEYKFFDNKKKKIFLNQLFDSNNKQNQSKIFNIKKPNFVFILWESGSGENFKQFGGTKKNHINILDTLLENSLSFNNFYSTATRTEQGIVALLSSFPGQPKTYLQSSQNKAIWLPNLSKELNKLGYFCSFYHTGSLEYQNTDNFLRIGGFKKIISNKSYDENWKFANDKLLFQKMKNEIESLKEPFFNMCLTSTSHEPFNSNVPKIFGENKYKNCIYYTGSQILQFINSIKEKKCYPNTIFIIMSDHAHSLPNERKMNEPMRFRIPFFIYGIPLKKEYRGKYCNVTGSQIDFNATILKQLDNKIITNKLFPWSKNLMIENPKNWAFYTFNNGFGVIRDKDYVVYDNDSKKIILKSKSRTKIIQKMENEGKAFIQEITESYDNLN